MRTHRVTGRPIAAVLALISACGVSVAFADPPAAPEATPAAAAPVAPATSAPAASPAAAPAKAAPAKETDAQLEKRLTNSGYKARMRNGTKVWCKREEELGSHLNVQEVCGTPDELRMVVQQNQDAMKDIQKLYNATLK
jgi:pyruvate/2-oxoglutarate dehydrogenase complex dihydrolipoamide acyltransferase (E2) component